MRYFGDLFNPLVLGRCLWSTGVRERHKFGSWRINLNRWEALLRMADSLVGTQGGMTSVRLVVLGSAERVHCGMCVGTDCHVQMHVYSPGKWRGFEIVD